MTRSFTSPEGQVWVYDFDSPNMTLKMAMAAESVFNYYGKVEGQAVRDPRAYESLGMENWLARAMSHLLIKVLPDGTEEKTGVKTQAEALKMLESLPAKEYDRLRECRTDFFIQSGIVDSGSIALLKTLFGGVENALALKTRMENDPEFAKQISTQESSGTPETSSAESAPTESPSSSGS